MFSILFRTLIEASAADNKTPNGISNFIIVSKSLLSFATIKFTTIIVNIDLIVKTGA